jgi:hypothetical protein
MIAASSPTLANIGNLPPVSYDYRLNSLEGTTKTTDNILSSTAEVVALTNTQAALGVGANSMCAVGSQLVDMVGYGSSYGTNKATSATPTYCFAGTGRLSMMGALHLAVSLELHGKIDLSIPSITKAIS